MILITGANGLAGSVVIREFARQQSPVRALVRSRAQAQALAGLPAVELVEGDMVRPETLAGALSGGPCPADIAKVAFALLHTRGHGGKRYETTGPEALSMTEIAEQITNAIGRTVRYVNVPPAQRSQALLDAGLPAYVVAHSMCKHVSEGRGRQARR